MRKVSVINGSSASYPRIIIRAKLGDSATIDLSSKRNGN